jgi:hypothetical protein
MLMGRYPWSMDFGPNTKASVPLHHWWLTVATTPCNRTSCHSRRPEKMQWWETSKAMP